MSLIFPLEPSDDQNDLKHQAQDQQAPLHELVETASTFFAQSA